MPESTLCVRIVSNPELIHISEKSPCRTSGPILPSSSPRFRKTGRPPWYKVQRVITEMRRSYENERDYAYEKAFAAHHLNQSTQTFQGRDHDRGRPRGHLEPLLHSQRRRRGGGPGRLPTPSRRRSEAVSGPGAGASRHGSRHALDLGQRADPGTRS